MPKPDFGQKKRTALTFDENDYFTRLTENAALITETLQLGREEAGVLDKKLNPDLLHVISRVIDLLHNPDYRDEAERELAAQNDPDVAIAILRQAFRIHSGRVNALLVRKLTDLCQTDGSGAAREALREATGSEIQRLSQLADEVFLNVGTEAELRQVAAGLHRTLNVRIRACHLLIKRHRCVEAVPIALELFVEGAKQPSAHKLLRRLSDGFGTLETLDNVQEKVVEPLLEYMQRYEREPDVLRYLLWAAGELHKPILAHIREIPVWQIQGRDMWLAKSLGECAFRSPSATQLMIDWMRNQEIDDYFKVRLSIRIKNKRVKFPQGAVDALTAALDDLPYRYEDRIRPNVENAIRNIKDEGPSRHPKDIYAKILGQYREDRKVDDSLLWDFRFTRGGINHLYKRLKRMDEEELRLLMLIVYHERFKGRWAERLNIVLDACPQLTSTAKRNVLHIIYELARNEPQTSKAWRRANEFLAQLVDAGDENSELARQIWKKLGEQG